MGKTDPVDQAVFDLGSAWPEIATRLDRVLVARKVPSWQRDDIIQETALRLFEMRRDLDPARSIEGLAVTVALNLLRDDYRALKRASSEAVPDRATTEDIETTVIAKLEVGRVGRALRRLNPRQRDAILLHLGDERMEATRSALRMLRMRARRRLAELVDRAEIFVFASRYRLGRALPLPEPASRHPSTWPGESPIGAVALALSALLASGQPGEIDVPAVRTPTPQTRPLIVLPTDAAKVLRAEEIIRAARYGQRLRHASKTAAIGDRSQSAHSDPEPPADVSLELAGASAEVHDGSGRGETKARIESGRTFIEIKP